ncbi:MAG: ATP-binding cassette domain-containing protein [Corynebacterium sp.]|nr:ATP-binding cassette domain-containing protein [Corynebacterium sp.]
MVIQIIAEDLTELSERLGAVDIQVSLLRETVIEELAMGLEHQGMPANDMQRLCNEYLTAFDLLHCAEKHPAQLSGGQTRRLALACLAITNPDSLVVYEPLAGLDSASQDLVIAKLKQLNTTVLSHRYDARWETATGCDLPAQTIGKPVTWLRGENGIGKTTLLRKLAGLDGGVFPQQTTSLALQDPKDQVIDSTVRSFVTAQHLRNVLAETLGIELDEHPLDLSPSKLRLVQVASVISQGRSVIILDEPNTHVTAGDLPILHWLIAEGVNSGAEVIITCHDPQFMETVAGYATVNEVNWPPAELIARAAST